MKRLTPKIAFLLLVVMGISLTAVAVTDEINSIAEQADKLYNQQRYSEAFPLMKRAAEGGDLISMFNLGTMYYEGKGTSKNLDQARHWWQEAANRGDTLAKKWLKRLDEQQNAASVTNALPAPADQTFTVNGVSFTMIGVGGGTFMMGATSEQGSDASDDEKPAHRVTVSSFHIGKYEVTQALWRAVMGNNPSRFKGDNLPVEWVNWDDCQEFIRKLNSLTGKKFRLPTEAEWEYAARGGNKSRGYKYSGSNTIGDVAWYDDNSGSKTHPVGTKAPNELGLYDMSGNVYEWCQDWYGKDYYSSSPSSNPTGPSSGSYRVDRGGGWSNDAGSCRVSNRSRSFAVNRISHLGLRLAF